MDSRLQEWTDELLAMSPEERTQHFRENRVKDQSALPLPAQEWRKQVLDEHRRFLDDNPAPPLQVIDHRESKAG